MGFVVPTDRFKFIFTSNFPLPSADDVKDMREKGGSKNMLQVHRNAIRDRVKYSDIHLSWSEQWGLVSDVLINNINLDHATDEVKENILHWTYQNWNKMTERSIRTVEKMLDTVLESPFDYVDSWEIDYLR
jgi:protein tyrosine phosphatase